jgi:uncharacterized protein
MSELKECDTIQRRAIPAGNIEIRAAENGRKVVTGYAAVFYREGEPGTEFVMYERGTEKFVERIMRTAFDRAVKEDDVRCLVNHNVELVIGRSKSGTLRLSVDERGLKYEADIPDTQTGRDLAELISRGDINGSSFAFRLDRGGATYREGGGLYIREVTAVKLYDVGPVTFPAYESADASVRSRDELCNEWRDNMPENIQVNQEPIQPDIDAINLLIAANS